MLKTLPPGPFIRERQGWFIKLHAPAIYKHTRLKDHVNNSAVIRVQLTNSLWFQCSALVMAAIVAIGVYGLAISGLLALSKLLALNMAHVWRLGPVSQRLDSFAFAFDWFGAVAAGHKLNMRQRDAVALPSVYILAVWFMGGSFV